MAASNRIDDSSPDSSPSRAARPCRSAPAGSIIDLRRLLAERFPKTLATGSDRLRTGLPAIDAAIGGLPKNAITELSSPNLSAGSALLLHALLQRAHRDGFFFALVDGRDSFDPQAAGPAALPNLLWVRCHQASQAIQAADLLLRDGNFPLVVLDLVLNGGDELRKIPQPHWYRLQRLVEAAPTAFLILTHHSIISSAQLKLSLENAWRLPDLEQQDLTARLNIQVDRVHGGREIMATAG
jgi:RecA DNA recombination protein